MHDILSKLTFGFLMAQFVPGATVVYCLSLVYKASLAGPDSSLQDLATEALDLWVASRTSATLVFIGLSTGAGMAIHGLHWGVMGFLENRHKIIGRQTGGPAPAATSFWHTFPIGVQILLGPIKLVVEILMMLTTRLRQQSLRDMAIEENVGDIAKEKMSAFQFIQDFYLYFAQFYAHLSYALVIACVLFVVLNNLVGFSWKATGIAALLYLASGFFFIIGRMQFASLFKAELTLTEKGSAGRSKTAVRRRRRGT